MSSHYHVFAGPYIKASPALTRAKLYELKEETDERLCDLPSEKRPIKGSDVWIANRHDGCVREYMFSDNYENYPEVDFEKEIDELKNEYKKEIEILEKKYTQVEVSWGIFTFNW